MLKGKSSCEPALRELPISETLVYTPGGKSTNVKTGIKDSVMLGGFFWLVGYLASLILFFTPLAGNLGWILIAIFTPFTIIITWWWFRARELPLLYYAEVGLAWMMIAVVFDYLFIVQVFRTPYYNLDVIVYYVLTFLVPIGVGLYFGHFSRKRHNI